MDTLHDMLNTQLGDFEFWRILAIFGVILVTYTVGKIGVFFLHRLANRLEAGERYLAAISLRAMGRSMTILAVVLGIYIGIPFLEVPPEVVGIFRTITAILLVLAVAVMAFRLTDVPAIWYEKHAERSNNQLERTLVPIVRTSLRLTVILLAFVQIAQILSDQPITSIIAGLGVGGLALALAAQDTIKNFFGSIVIISDKPYQVGERVVVDGHDGAIESVGMRSTRIRTLEGNQVTIPNGEMANKSILNIGRRPFIRRVANITITYDTPPEKVREAVRIIEEVLDQHEGMKPDFPPRVYFNDFNSASLNILMIYWYHPPNFWDYFKFTEWVNHEIFRRYGEAGIDFAFPTQTIHLAGDQKRPLKVGIQDLDRIPE